MTAIHEVILQSLEGLEDCSVNLNVLIYDHFYQSCPGAEELMGHMDELTKGKMMEEVTRLMLVEEVARESEYLDFELRNHRFAYSVDQVMYPALLNSFYHSLREVLSESWLPAFDKAWEARISELNDALEQHAPISYLQTS